MKNNRNIKLMISSFILISCFMTSQRGTTQTWGNGWGVSNDRWTINDDNSNHWSYLRLQVADDRAWNMVNQGDLWWGYAPNGNHNNRGSEKMRLTNTGKLGIGTNNPTAYLHVAADGTDQLTVEPKSSNNNSAAVKIIGHRSANITDNAAQLILQNYDHDAPGITNSLGMIAGKVTDQGANLGDMIFYNYTDGISSSETMRLTHNGRVGIGTATPLTRFHVTGTSYLNGNVGIGVANPQTPLHVTGTSYFNGNVGIGTATPTNNQSWGKVLDVYHGAHTKIVATTGTENVKTGIFSHSNWSGSLGPIGVIGTESNHDLKLMAGYGSHHVTLKTNGNLGVGTANPAEKLEVTGNIKANGVILNIGSFPDYVFEKEYPLMPLQEVENYINTNKHLPGFPSEAEVVKTGANLGRLNNLLVEKVEELTLYTIAQDKQIDKLIGELAALKSQLEVLLKKQ